MVGGESVKGHCRQLQDLGNPSATKELLRGFKGNGGKIRPMF